MTKRAQWEVQPNGDMRFTRPCRREAWLYPQMQLAGIQVWWAVNGLVVPAHEIARARAFDAAAGRMPAPARPDPSRRAPAGRCHPSHAPAPYREDFHADG